MHAKLNLKQFCIDTFSFIARNGFILCLFGLASFIASFLSLKYAFKHQTVMLVLYGIFCYLFYYLYISFYYEQKPIFTSEKLVNSLVKAVIIFAFSLFIVMCLHIGLKILKYMAQFLVGFPDVYAFLKNTYYTLNASKSGQFFLYIPILFFLTFTFFIPGFSFISTINGLDSSLISSYTKTYGNFFKIALIIFVLYALLPFAWSFITPQTPHGLATTHAIITVLQTVFYIRLYDFFYSI